MRRRRRGEKCIGPKRTIQNPRIHARSGSFFRDDLPKVSLEPPLSRSFQFFRRIRWVACCLPGDPNAIEIVVLCSQNLRLFFPGWLLSVSRNTDRLSVRERREIPRIIHRPRRVVDVSGLLLSSSSVHWVFFPGAVSSNELTNERSGRIAWGIRFGVPRLAAGRARPRPRSSLTTEANKRTSSPR